MFAELHLAKHPFALHLLLQRPEGLVDVVVTDENLHVVFLLIQRLIGPIAKAPDPWRTDMFTLPISNNHPLCPDPKFPSAEPIQHLAAQKATPEQHNGEKTSQAEKRSHSKSDQIAFCQIPA
jgi:hypothetical protein